MTASFRLVLVLLPLAGCVSSVEPLQMVTLQVSNATCDGLTCSALRIRAFPGNQPHTPGGFWSLDLGIVATPTACLRLPASGKFEVTDAGTGKTTTYTWNTAKALALGAQARSESGIQATPSTPAFIPALESGWSVTLPGSAAPVPASACAP